MLLSISLFAVIFWPNLASAHLGEFRLVTWNMQGATTQGESTWYTDVNRLILGDNNIAPHDVIALQEAGAVPASAVATGVNLYTPGVGRINEYTWQLGSNSRGTTVYIYHLQVPDDNGVFALGYRNNMAIVTTTRAVDFRLMQQQNDGHGSLGRRPAIGVTLRRAISATTFWTMHAGSYGNSPYNDAQNMVNAINNNSGTPSFAILGDFNRAPNLLALPANTYLYNSARATQMSGNELDYMLSSDAMVGWGGHIVSGVLSDHAPVEFRMGGASGEGHIALKLRDQRKCVDVSGGRADNGTNVQLWDCLDVPQQRWSFETDGTVRSLGKCLDVIGGVNKNGARVGLWQCEAGNRNQQWNARADGALIHQLTGKCLDIQNARANNNGAQLDIFDCEDSFKTDMRWVIPAHEGRIITENGHKCLDVKAGDASNGTQVQLWDCIDLPIQFPQQRWTFAMDGTVRALGKCLDVISGNTGNGVRVGLWVCEEGNPNQQWRVTTKALIHPLSGKCLDIDPNAGIANGAPTQQWTCMQGRNQRWEIPVMEESLVLNTAANKCLDTFNGAVKIWDCLHEGDVNSVVKQQTIAIEVDGTIQASGGMCLSASGPNASVTWNECNNTMSQQWRFLEGGSLYHLGNQQYGVFPNLNNNTQMQLQTSTSGIAGGSSQFLGR